jgi:putative restriction endonuclease
MAFGVFIHRSDSIYEDSPAEQYQFPSQYLTRVRACIGNWMIYYEPRKVVNTRGYFAVARISDVVPDPSLDGMYRALIEPGSYLELSRPVPFAQTEGPVERGLLNDEGRISGRAQSAVRSLSRADFSRILRLGFDEGETLLPRVDGMTPHQFDDGEQAPFELETDRVRVDYLTSRIVRDRVFRRVVLQAYDFRCSITGLRLINGGGRAEVDAAHIKPVQANGPDAINNGLALSGTAHWMFDRGLIALQDDLQIMISRHVNDPESVRGLLNKTGSALLPLRASDRPHPHFLSWHRENCFKA